MHAQTQELKPQISSCCLQSVKTNSLVEYPINTCLRHTRPRLCGLCSAAMRLMFPLAQTIKTIFGITLINIQILLRPVLP